MFVIVHEGLVIKGPHTWNKLRFEEVIREECEVECTLNTRNDEGSPVIISNTVKILPVVSKPEPTFNPRTQYLNGPFWKITNTSAEMSYKAENLNLIAVKSFFMEKVTALRWTKENSGIAVTIQGSEVFVDTSRESRTTFLHTFSTMADNETLNWKFPQQWLTISKTDLGTIITAGRNHIQSCFDWEKSWITRVENAATLANMNTLYDELEAE